MQKNLSRYWLLIGVWALAIAGLFALVLVIGRAPVFSGSTFFATFFFKALVVHVDLSVLVWFLSIACLLWSRATTPARQILPLEEAALISFALGTLAIAISAFDPRAQAFMSNYIPVIMSPEFFLGLGLLLCGVALMLARLFSARPWSTELTKPLKFGLLSAGFIALIAVMSFYWSFSQMPKEIDGQQYYDLGFWGGGHVLQFLHAQILIVVWLMLAMTLKPGFKLPRKWLKVLLSIGLATTLIVPVAYMLYDVTSMQHREFFTRAMILTNGPPAGIVGIFVLAALWQTRNERKGDKKALWATLLISVLLYLYGGMLGDMIKGENVVIPAHYHGSIVGITLAFMGVAYLFLPQLGYRDPSGTRLAFWQPIVYGVGQFFHVSGLAWSGGYGVLRKTPGGLADLPASVKAAMGIMGIGGLIAIIGGFMFVIVVWKAVKK